MGETLSKAQEKHAHELYQAIRQCSDESVSISCLRELIREVDCQCPWYPSIGAIDPATWERIGRELKAEPRAPMHILVTWQKVSKALSALEGPGNLLLAASEKPVPASYFPVPPAPEVMPSAPESPVVALTSTTVLAPDCTLSLQTAGPQVTAAFRNARKEDPTFESGNIAFIQ